MKDISQIYSYPSIQYEHFKNKQSSIKTGFYDGPTNILDGCIDTNFGYQLIDYYRLLDFTFLKLTIEFVRHDECPLTNSTDLILNMLT